MSRLCSPGFALVFLLGPGLFAADDPVFSGPQVGEKLPHFRARGVFGKHADKEIDVVQLADGKPLALIFVHARTRPAFGLTNTIMRYVAQKSQDGMTGGVVFLTDDPTETIAWMRRIENYFPKGIAYGVSADGVEGPGSYGLNRNVTLTVLVGNAGKVTANLALVQPGLEVDGPKILRAIVDVTGGGKVPTIAELGGNRYQARMRPNTRGGQEDARLVALLRAVINKEATAEQVREAADKVEQYVAQNESARRQLARRVTAVVKSDRLSNYGTKAAQEILRRWAREYGEAAGTQPAQPAAAPKSR